MVPWPPTEGNYVGRGTTAPWYEGWDITEERRNEYRERSKASHIAKLKAVSGQGPEPRHPVNRPNLDPDELMPQRESHGITALSLFSGGGGLDLGFDRAGFAHITSYEILDFAAETLTRNRPSWEVAGGSDGDVTRIDWRSYRDRVNVVHGGPPCQPFSVAGRQRGGQDWRDMLPELVRAVLEIQPLAFALENVPGLWSRKFAPYLDAVLHQPLSAQYKMRAFVLDASSFGVPQVRRRLFYVGFRQPELLDRFDVPGPTHYWHHLKGSGKSRKKAFTAHQITLGEGQTLQRCMGARAALGLPNTSYDSLAPTLRSGLTGPRNTTSVLSSTGAQKQWAALGIWPNGVAADRKSASEFVPENGHFRLSVPDCAILQGFPESWQFNGPVYKMLGQIGNAVAPPVGNWVANSMAQVLVSSA